MFKCLRTPEKASSQSRDILAKDSKLVDHAVFVVDRRHRLLQ